MHWLNEKEQDGKLYIWYAGSCVTLKNKQTKKPHKNTKKPVQRKVKNKCIKIIEVVVFGKGNTKRFVPHRC